MKEPQITVFVFALSLLHYSSCIEKLSKFRRLSLTPSRFAHTFTDIEGIALLECAVCGTNEDVLDINYQANSRGFELIKRTDGCIEYESGNMTGWQALRTCDSDTTGMIWFFDDINIYRELVQRIDYKNPSRVCGRVTRLCRLMPNSDPRDIFVYSIWHTHVGFFFLHTLGHSALINPVYL